MTKLAVLALSLFAFTANVFAAGYEFEGIGVNEVSRGGAAIASVDNWTAIYWNPARLTMNDKSQLAGEFWSGWSSSYDGNSLGESPGGFFAKKKLNSNANLGAWGSVLPLANKKIVFGFGMYTPLLQGVKFEDISIAGTDTKLESFGGIISSNLSLGIKIFPSLSFGLGMNILRAEIKTDLQAKDPLFQSSTYYRGYGWGGEGLLGLNWQISPRLSFGTVYRSGTKIPIKTQAQGSLIMPAFGVNIEEKSDMRFDFVCPSTAGIGINYLINSLWAISFDINRTWWSRFKDAIDFSQEGGLFADRKNSFHWKDTAKLRLGSSFQWTEKTQLLLGYSFDQYAIDSGGIDFSTAIDVNMNRFSAGINYLLTENAGLGLGVVYGAGRRTENYSGEEVIYKLSGGQLMTELRYNF